MNREERKNFIIDVYKKYKGKLSLRELEMITGSCHKTIKKIILENGFDYDPDEYVLFKLYNKEEYVELQKMCVETKIKMNREMYLKKDAIILTYDFCVSNLEKSFLDISIEQDISYKDVLESYKLHNLLKEHKLYNYIDKPKAVKPKKPKVVKPKKPKVKREKFAKYGDCSGLYLIVAREKLEDGSLGDQELYVGQSVNIRNRMKDHRREKFSNYEFEYYVIQKIEHPDKKVTKRLMDVYECYWIRKFNSFFRGLNDKRGNTRTSSYPCYLDKYYDSEIYPFGKIVPLSFDCNRIVEMMFGVPEVYDQKVLEYIPINENQEEYIKDMEKHCGYKGIDIEVIFELSLYHNIKKNFYQLDIDKELLLDNAYTSKIKRYNNIIFSYRETKSQIYQKYKNISKEETLESEKAYEEYCDFRLEKYVETLSDEDKKLYNYVQEKSDEYNTFIEELKSWRRYKNNLIKNNENYFKKNLTMVQLNSTNI